MSTPCASTVTLRPDGQTIPTVATTPDAATVLLDRAEEAREEWRSNGCGGFYVSTDSALSILSPAMRSRFPIIRGPQTPIELPAGTPPIRR